MLARASLSFVAVAAVTSLCSCAGAPAEDEEPAVEGELRTGTVVEFTLTRSESEAAVEAGCDAVARFTVNFPAKTFTSTTCTSGDTRFIDRALSTAELDGARAALAAVRTTKRPRRCAADAAALALSVTRNATETEYVAAPWSCSGGTPVTQASLADLAALLEQLDDASASQTFEGTLMAVSSSGGSTGRALYTDSTSYELVLDAAEQAQFVSGQRARVSGTVRQKRSTTNPSRFRRLLTVEDMVVCPAGPKTFNCMPRRSSNMCENASWLRANCPGIDFVY